MPPAKPRNVSARQIKAARALLDWSQETLASESGLSIATIRNIEAGYISPRDKTTGAIVTALENADIEFYGNTGVRVKENIITMLEGEDSYLRLLDEEYSELKDTRSEILVWYADNSVSPAEVIEKETKMRKNGLRFRLLVEEGSPYIYFPLDECRMVPKKYFRNTVIEIYGNKVALCLYPNPATNKIKSVLIIENPALTDAMRNSFNFMWDNCRKPSHTTAPKVFD